MTETNTDKILNGFRKWLTDEGYAQRSADSYCSGIRRVNKEFFFPMCHKDMFDELTGAITQGTAVDWLTALLGTIGAKVAETTDPTAKKRLQDNVSHLRKFIEYIADAQDAAGLPVDEEYVEIPEFPHGVFLTGDMFTTRNIAPNHQYFDHDSLVNIFSGRIRTQDRISGGKNVFFPIRILGKLLSDAIRNHKELFDSMGIKQPDGKPFDFRRWYAAWVRGMVEDVVFHTTKGDYKLSEIEGLKIERSTKRVWVVDKKNKRTIPVQSEGPSGMAQMEVDKLKDIHLDHSERMEDMLNRLEPALVTMRKLTDDIKNAVKGQTVTIKDKDKSKDKSKDKDKNKVVTLDSYRAGTLTVLSSWYCNQVDWNFIAPLLPHLCTELNYIAAATHLTAMSAAHNLEKH